MKLDFSTDPEFGGASWTAWRAILDRVTDRTRELWVLAGRGSGKTRMASRIVVEHALREWPHAAGERIYAALIAPSREQAAIAMGYVRAAIPTELIQRETREQLDLKNGNSILVVTASTAAPRGRSYSCAVLDEIAFLPTDDAADPDSAILTAIRPGLARVPGSMLVAISSPWARRGELFRAAQRWGATGGDEAHVFAQASTSELNPLFDTSEIARAFDEDSVAASTEYDANFRTDCETFLSRDTIDAAVERRGDLPWRPDVAYRAFADPSGGSGDSYTLAVAHDEGGVVIVDAVREAKPPFDPDEITRQFAEVVKGYGLGRVVGDRYAGEWPRSRWRVHEVQYVPAEKTASGYYQAALPLFSAGRIRLPNHARLIAQLVGLERTVARSGRETISHPPGGHDDLANAIVGAAVEASTRASAPPLSVAANWGAPREMHGLDARGREWRDGRPWSGIFTEYVHFSMKGQPLDFPEKYVDGQRVELTEAEKQYFITNPPRPRKERRLLWG